MYAQDIIKQRALQCAGSALGLCHLILWVPWNPRLTAGSPSLVPPDHRPPDGTQDTLPPETRCMHGTLKKHRNSAAFWPISNGMM